MARRPVLENAVMDVLWDSAEWLTPREVQAKIPHGTDLAYTTVMTALLRLWRKGRLERRKVGRAYAYTPALSREQHAALQMAEMLEIAHDRDAALSRFVDSLDQEDRNRLQRLMRGR